MSSLFSLLSLLIVLALLFGMGFGLFLLARKLMQPAAGSSVQSTTAGQDNDAAALSRNSNSLRGLGNNMSIRSLAVGFIGLLMLIPLFLVSDLVRERQYLYQSVLEDIAASWGERQELHGPALAIPYVVERVHVENITGEDGKIRTVRTPRLLKRTAIALPDELNIDVAISGEYRHRGIYESLVYTAELSLTGNFKRPEIEKLDEQIKRIDWEKARLVIGISDTRAIVSSAPLQWNQESQDWAPGTQLDSISATGFHAPLALNPLLNTYEFSANLRLNGSDGFYFAPFGKNTHTQIRSAWPHPSFQGAILPSQYEVGDQGFTADWSIPHLARNYPQLWTDESKGVSPAALYTTGVRLFQPVFLYSLVERAVKYGLLFIALTFMTFIIFELTIRRRLHYVQYGLIGVALALFYLTLLSLAEHFAFAVAYFAAAGTAIGMIGLYTLAALRDAKRAGLIVLLLVGLYTLLYSILHLEDYALLMGTGLLLLVIAVLMYVTRNLQRDE